MLLLSRPLPDAVPLPASAQPFFLRAFERAVKSPDAATLRSLYLILNGACGLISLLDPKDRERLDRGLKQLLSSQEASRNAMLLLWCFAIIPYLDSAEEKWRTASGRKCFGSEDDMHKTIDFAALSVVYVLSENANVTGNLALESVAIAIRTILVAHVNTRQKWLTSSRLAKKVYQKLPEKLLQVTHSHALQLEVC
ncbi:hypothetical protein EJ04DRAFT_789 [Polyplosphaeria fusca]|uniref:Uncharacterized protein n=1 Tax=Polyplosphaeria fusca TaxID=682080 RepID=A0A9P4RAN7_9PLEO|nr:hypothetical protein EJ04DRAFT_789 [Polyplosphaeria fusca]